MTEEMVSCPSQTTRLAHENIDCVALKLSCIVGTFFILQALRVSDRYPVEVEFRSTPPYWMANSNNRCDSTDAPKASVNRAVTGKEQNCNLQETDMKCSPLY